MSPPSVVRAVPDSRPDAASLPADAPDADCRFCGHVNPRGARYCNACSEPLHMQPCPACNAVDKRASTACYRCGATFPVRASAPAASGAIDERAADATRRPDSAETSIARAAAATTVEQAMQAPVRAAGEARPSLARPSRRLALVAVAAGGIVVAIALAWPPLRTTGSAPIAVGRESRDAQRATDVPASASTVPLQAPAPASAPTGKAQPSASQAPVAEAIGAATRTPQLRDDARTDVDVAREDDRAEAGTPGAATSSTSSVAEPGVPADANAADCPPAVAALSLCAAGRASARPSR